MQTSAVPAVAAPAPLVRIRYVLVVGVLVTAGLVLVPRARAAFQLYSAATAFADYALCMVGPTGPSLLRDNPQEFWRLARRRLVTSLPDDHPFKKCEKTAAALAGTAISARAHVAAASSFVEWGGEGVDGPPQYRLSDLGVGTRRLADLAERAWPFVRDGYTSLVQPSSYAPEAPHPLEPPRPGAARGAVPRRTLARCESADQAAEFVLDLSSDRRFKVVRSSAGGGERTEARFASAEARVFSVSCDGAKVLVGFGREGSRDVWLASCALGGGCEKVELPKLVPGGPPVRFPLDVARVDGVDVAAMTMQGIVRVASSRDDGATWTPLMVAFDPAEHGGRTDTAARLVTVGHRLLLIGSGTGNEYWVLASDDAGASWHAP